MLSRFIQQLLFPNKQKVYKRKKLVSTPRKPRTHKTDPKLYELWIQIRKAYFPEQSSLDSYTVCWSSRRQKRVLGSCNLRKQVVKVAQELKDSEFEPWLEPLLYHEMCHASIGLEVERSGGKRRWHGHEFKMLEARHPKIHELDVWIKSGGWRYAVRKHRGKAQYNKVAA